MILLQVLSHVAGKIDRHDPNFIMLDILECVNVTQYHTYTYVKSMFLCYIIVDTQVGANVLI